jgi:hypothetical protein
LFICKANEDFQDQVSLKHEMTPEAKEFQLGRLIERLTKSLSMAIDEPSSNCSDSAVGTLHAIAI